MIGIVVVSHSRALAKAAVALAEEMVEVDARPQVSVAAGLDEETFGTDATQVSEAITAVDSPDGVLVLLDLGSAVLSAEMALEFLDPQVAARVQVSSAPLVEGLVAAMVTAATGADLSVVRAEAERGLEGKAGHLGAAEPGNDAVTGANPDGAPAEAKVPSGAPVSTQELVLTGEHGLHARPAAKFVTAVNGFPDAQVTVRNLDSGRGPVNGASLSAVATLDARQGHRLEVSATGPQAKHVLEALAELNTTAFGDLTSAPVTAPSSSPVPGDRAAERAGDPQPPAASAVEPALIPADAAVGPVVRPQATGAPDLTAYLPGEPAHERERLDDALAAARADLTRLVEQTRARVGEAEASIFEAHLQLLSDPGLIDPVTQAVDDGEPAATAWQAQIASVRTAFDGLAEDYQRERAQDVSSVGDRVLRALLGEQPPESPSGSTGPGILVVDKLDPAAAATLDPERVRGVITLRGGATGHGVIVARALGLPVLTGAGPSADVPEGTVVAFDARTGRLVVEPDEATVAEFEQLLHERVSAYRTALAAADEPARTTDGHTVLVKANVGLTGDATTARRAGADGSGLVRTEVLFGERTTAPTVAEQVEVFTAIAEALDGRPITIRTWDVGGDKPLPFHEQPPEANPFLGVRGLRAFRADPAPLLDQLEAVCRVAARHAVRVMFPMVATVEEVDWALARLEEAAGRLSDGRPDTLEVGIMIEVPAAALRAEALSTQLDFVSIGSNDLTQYVLAAERGNPALAELGDTADPAVLQLIRRTCDDVADGVQVCVCGDAASDPALAGVLVGLGVTELSAAAAALPTVKAGLRAHSLTGLQDLADRALHCDSAAEVRALLG